MAFADSVDACESTAEAGALCSDETATWIGMPVSGDAGVPRVSASKAGARTSKGWNAVASVGFALVRAATGDIGFVDHSTRSVAADATFCLRAGIIGGVGSPATGACARAAGCAATGNARSRVAALSLRSVRTIAAADAEGTRRVRVDGAGAATEGRCGVFG
jgi:hypothetical protein